MTFSPPQINPSKWKIKLPIYPPGEVTDNSTNTEYASCPRKGLYRYGMRRGFEGKSWPIQYGLAFHKYREVVGDQMAESKGPMTDEIHEKGIEAAVEGWEQPPLEHKKGYLDLHRLMLAIEQGRKKVEYEYDNETIIVTRTEDSFDLELPFRICLECGWTRVTTEPHAFTMHMCSQCSSTEEMITPRHGGRVDQFVNFVALGNANMIRDFKTTGWAGKEKSAARNNYPLKFDPNSQLQGYTWSGCVLSGEEFKGVIIETVYNTKDHGPEIFQNYVEFSKGQIIQWLASVMMERQMLQAMWARVDELGYLAFPQRTNNCMNFGRCGFIDACKASSGWEIEQWLENYTVYSHWDFTNPDEEESKV